MLFWENDKANAGLEAIEEVGLRKAVHAAAVEKKFPKK